MNIREMVKAYLKEHGYGGLCNYAVGCFGCRLGRLFVDTEEKFPIDRDIIEGAREHHYPCGDALMAGTCMAGYFNHCATCSYNENGHCKEYDEQLPDDGKNKEAWCIHHNKAE